MCLLIEAKKWYKELKVGNTYKDAKKIFINDLDKWETKILRIADLFMRLNTKQAELVATAIYSYNYLNNINKPSEKEIVKYILDWKQKRKPEFEKDEVALAVRNLASLNWINPIANRDLLPVDSV